MEGSKLTRDETLKSTEPITIRRWWIAVPTTTALNESSLAGSRRIDEFALREKGMDLVVTSRADWPLKTSLLASEDTPLGRGARGAIPLHLVYESRDLHLEPNRPKTWLLVVGLAPFGKPLE